MIRQIDERNNDKGVIQRVYTVVREGYESESGGAMAMRPETVRFWLGRNKQVYGLVTAKAEGDLLVLYQSRYYVVRGDASILKNGRPVRFTPSTLPASWRRMLNGMPEDGTLPLLEPDSTPSKWDRVEAPSPFSIEKRNDETGVSHAETTAETTTETERGGVNMEGESQAPESSLQKEEESAAVTPKRAKKGEGAKPAKGEPIAFACPYCNHRAEAPPARKDGKPFFQTCEKCNGEFAVRIVPVTVYQAEVAAFPRKGNHQ